MTAPCGCSNRGLTHRDPQQHAAWHALVVEQGGPSGAVDAASLRAARGYRFVALPSETLLDTRARQSGKRASGEQRRRAS